MTVGRICSRIMASVSPRETIRTAAERMAANEVGTLVVLDATDGTSRLGIVTDRDIVLRCVAHGRDPDRSPVASIMTSPVHSVDEQMSVEEAIEQMAKVGTRRLLVVGGGGAPVGVLSLDDILDLLADETGAIGRLLAKQQSHVFEFTLR